jgi:hypothetical protein
VVEDIFSYVEGNDLVVEKNFSHPLSVSLSGTDKNNLQYSETQQKIRVPITPGAMVTLTESL